MLMNFTPGFGLDEEQREYVRMHLQSRAALDPEEKQSYGIPKLADQSVLVALNWHLGILQQDRPIFLLFGLLALGYLAAKALYVLMKWPLDYLFG